MYLSPSRKPNYWTFGYLPSGSARQDLLYRLTGAHNLLKRLQAPDILRALDIRPSDVVLDFGCGSGYITIELAKLAQKAVGIDVNEFITRVPIPTQLQNKLEFRQSSGAALPFSDAAFDTVLASEVLPMSPDPAVFLREMRRVIKPGGRLVIVNGTGPIVIRDMYANGGRYLNRLRRRFSSTFPETYDDYVVRFQRAAGTSQTRFLSEEEVIPLLIENGFAIQSVGYSPKGAAGDWFAKRQFEHFLATGTIAWPRSFFLNFVLLTFRSLFDRSQYRGGLIVVASRNP